MSDPNLELCIDEYRQQYPALLTMAQAAEIAQRPLRDAVAARTG